MNRSIYIYFFLFVIFLAGCASNEVTSRNYYILEYLEHTEKDELFQETPMDSTIQIMTTRIPQTYNRRQLVVRHTGLRITYSDYHSWGVKLSEIMPSLISKRLTRYNLFSQVQDDMIQEPNFSIRTTVNKVELYELDNSSQARLNMDFYLTEGNGERVLVSYNIDAQQKVVDNEIDTYVQSINEMILDGTDEFIKEMLNYFAGKTIYSKFKHQVTERYDTSIDQILDEEQIDKDNGLLLLPAITKTDNEPYFKAYNEYGYQFFGKMGESLSLSPGEYTIYYGSGDEDQLMIKKKVEVITSYKTIIDPDWGCLLVDVMDEKRNFAKVKYEIFDAETGASYGSEFPAEKEVGEQEKVWVLKPGLYKVTINNEPFNTYRDFTTVYIEEDKSQKLSIVVDLDEDGNPEGLIGSGVVDESSLQALDRDFDFYSAIHGNVNFNSSNEEEKDEYSSTVTFNVQMDNHIDVDRDPLHYTMKNLIELGTSKTTDTDFRVAADEFDLKNTLIYYFFENLGLYSRFDVNSHFFEGVSYNSSKFYYSKYHKDGTIHIADRYDDEVKISNPFFPLVLKEGLGVNLRLLKKSKANLSLRAGFGLRQDLKDDVYELTYSNSDSTGVEHRIYTEKESTDQTGTEVALVGSFKLPLGLDYSLNADFLFPFDTKESMIMEWENSFNLKLFKYISLDYKLQLENKNPDIGGEYIADTHTLFLRITYILR